MHRLSLFPILILGVSILTPLLFGCASSGSSTEFRLQTLETQQLEMQKKLLDRERRIAMLEQELANLRADSATVQNKLNAYETISKKRTATPAPRKKAVLKPKKKPAKKPAPAPTPQPTPTPKPASVAYLPTPTPTASPHPTKSASPVASPATKSDYDRALELIRSGRTNDARPLLKKFLTSFPKDRLRPNALYWLGETFYADKRYDEAILTFKEVAGKFPHHNKASASMLKIGYCYEQLNDAPNAQFYLQALIDEYPGSESAKLAKQRLSGATR